MPQQLFIPPGMHQELEAIQPPLISRSRPPTPFPWDNIYSAYGRPSDRLAAEHLPDFFEQSADGLPLSLEEVSNLTLESDSDDGSTVVASPMGQASSPPAIYQPRTSSRLIDLYPFLPDSSVMKLADCYTGVIYGAEVTLRPAPRPRPGCSVRFDADLQRISLTNKEEEAAASTQSYSILPQRWVSIAHESENERSLLFIGSLIHYSDPNRYSILPVGIEKLDYLTCPALMYDLQTRTPELLDEQSLSTLCGVASFHERWDEKLEFQPPDDFNYLLKKNMTYRQVGSPPMDSVNRAMDRFFHRLGLFPNTSGTYSRLPRDAHLPFEHNSFKPLPLDSLPYALTAETRRAQHELATRLTGASTYERWFECYFLPLRRRYYDAYNCLSMSYKHILLSWCTRLRGAAIADMTPRPLYTEVDRNVFSISPPLLIRGRGKLDDAVALQHIRVFLQTWKPMVPAGKSIEKLTTIRCIWAFAELLLRDSMEDERALWEDVIRLHTGLTLKEIVRDYNCGAGSVVDRDTLYKYRMRGFIWPG